MVMLKYTGPDPAVVGVVPLPEGWPALTHQDDDKERVKEKLASGHYEKVSASEAKEEAAGEPVPLVESPAPEPAKNKE